MNEQGREEPLPDGKDLSTTRAQPQQQQPFSFGQWKDSLLLLARQQQLYLKLLYLLSSVVLGPLGSAVLLLGILGGIATPAIWLGFPLLFLMLYIWWGLALLERALARSCLHVEIAPLPMALFKALRGQRWANLRQHLCQRITWKALAYLLLKGPFGVGVGSLLLGALIFSLSAVLLSLLLSLIVFPFVALGRSMVRQERKRLVEERALSLLWAGIAVALSPLSLLHTIAELWGYFVCIMLTVDKRERELQQARILIKQERSRAERAEQQRRDLIANLSHDLRTPVANIRGYVQALAKLTEKPEESPITEHHHYLAILEREAIRLGTLFDELLALAQDEAQELRLSMTAVDVGEVIEEVYQTIKPLAYQQRRVIVSKMTPPGLPPAKVDRQRLLQVLLNLVRNAIAYTPEGGLVMMTLEPTSEQHLALLVADTGMGIAQEDQEQIFERFYRSKSSHSQANGGFGLGLAIVRELIEAMGGSVALESTAGEGSCFKIVLPIADQSMQKG
ncbi:hypothetical protein EPA93_27015 [Ktedonosporobacter rubrisoli]|uniref:histidine kinase n=1 Tax=Ktedonosporobacter rubrisoli TaxID=2509675 RepID=A0A4P6JUV8_KTERU|nr:ATP-binding protein [Ktedonosporobacter rubrisoli]QBD79438.1 hypothetical protein EPA93_27015 [Ktedonosporobacter rubrisoli]